MKLCVSKEAALPPYLQLHQHHHGSFRAERYDTSLLFSGGNTPQA